VSRGSGALTLSSEAPEGLAKGFRAVTYQGVPVPHPSNQEGVPSVPRVPK